MPVIKLDLPIEDLNEWARLANERQEPVRVTLSKFVSQEARKLTKRASDGLESPAKKQSSTAEVKHPAKKRKVTSRA